MLDACTFDILYLNPLSAICRPVGGFVTCLLSNDGSLFCNQSAESSSDCVAAASWDVRGTVWQKGMTWLMESHFASYGHHWGTLCLQGAVAVEGEALLWHPSLPPTRSAVTSLPSADAAPDNSNDSSLDDASGAVTALRPCQQRCHETAVLQRHPNGDVPLLVSHSNWSKPS